MMVSACFFFFFFNLVYLDVIYDLSAVLVESERDMVSQVFKNAISSLNEDDRQLPQIEHILPLLRRGIGIHHGGLLPILKETIEILFQEGLLKVLFATETFSIGLNMPAKTVVFTSVRKFDGKDTRWVSIEGTQDIAIDKVGIMRVEPS